MEDGSRAKVDEFDNVTGCHDTIIEFKITMGETDRVEVVNAFTDLTEDTIDLGTAHSLRHDDTKEIIRCVLHNLHHWSNDVRDVGMGNTS